MDMTRTRMTIVIALIFLAATFIFVGRTNTSEAVPFTPREQLIDDLYGMSSYLKYPVAKRAIIDADIDRILAARSKPRSAPVADKSNETTTFQVPAQLGFIEPFQLAVPADGAATSTYLHVYNSNYYVISAGRLHASDQTGGLMVSITDFSDSNHTVSKMRLEFMPTVPVHQLTIISVSDDVVTLKDENGREHRFNLEELKFVDG